MRLRGGGGIGLGGIAILLILSLVFRQDLTQFIDPGAGAAPTAETGPVAESPEEARMVQFVSFVLDSAQSHWDRTFAEMGAQYQPATLVLYRDLVESACGRAGSSTGPFYCPADGKVYIDLGFFDELDARFGAPGDFAQAYVLAHEIGHHVQTLLGLEDRLRQFQQRNPAQSNQAQVRFELQADCLAGVWGHETRQLGILEPGDLEEGLGAAAAVGDDRLQRAATGQVNPESFTHGSSEERMRWFRRGFDAGRVDQCDTFSGSI
jgi:predicted metalloprotease